MQFVLSLRTGESSSVAGAEIAVVLRGVADRLEKEFSEVAEEEGDLIVGKLGEAIGKWSIGFDEPLLEQPEEAASSQLSEESRRSGRNANSWFGTSVVVASGTQITRIFPHCVISST